MGWYEQLEKRRGLLIGGITVVCIAILAVSSRRETLSHDSFWHLRAGLDWINSGLSPWFDHYSFTFQGHPITNPPVLFQAIIATLVKQFGLDLGFEIFKWTSSLLSLGFLVYFMKKLRVPVIVVLLVLPTFVFLFQLRAIVRPELLSYTFSIIAVFLYHRSRSTLTPGTMVPIVVLLALWNNYHQPIFGYVIFSGLFLDVAVRFILEKSALRDWLVWFAWGVVIFLVGFINHDFSHPVIAAITFPAEWKSYIQEYKSPAHLLDMYAIYVLLAILALTVILAVRLKKYGYLFVTCVLAFLSIKISRLVTPSGIILLCLLISLSSDADLRRLFNSFPRWANSIAGLFLMSLFLISLLSSVQISRAFMERNMNSPSLFPEQIVDYMKDQDMSGRIFNEYRIGGYLIFKMAPETQVFIDGRTGILYPVDHYQNWLKLRTMPSALRAESEEKNIELALLRSDPKAFLAMHDTGLFSLDFIDANYSLFTTNQSNFPKSGLLLAQPACWESEMLDAISQEQVTALWTLPANSTLHHYLGFVLAYTKTDAKKKLLESVSESDVQDIHILRFASFQAMMNEWHEISLSLLEKFEFTDINEYLAAAFNNIRLEKWEAAEQLVDSASRISWINSDYSELLLTHLILKEIDDNYGFELIPEDYIQRVRQEVEQSGYSNDLGNNEKKLFCDMKERAINN